MSLWFQLPATGLSADKLKNIFDGSRERKNTAMRLFPCCCHFQIASVGATIIFNLSFINHIFQTGHQVLIMLSTHKVCYEDPGNKTDL